MKIFNKITALFIIASFMFCGDVLARRSEESKRISIQKRAKRIPLAREGKKTKLSSRRKSSRIKKATVNKPIAKRQRRVAHKQVPTTHNRVARKSAAKVTPTKPVGRTKTVNTVRHTPASKPTKTVARKKPVNTVRHTPVEKNRRVSAKAPKYYTIKTSDLPADLQSDVKLFALGKGEKLQAQYKVKPHEIRELLAEMQEIENHAPGITQRAHAYLAANGYNPASNNNVWIFTHDLPKDLKYYVNTFVLEEGEPLMPVYTLPQAKLTKMLNKMRQREERSVGMTLRIRQFLQAQYGFQG